jgi:hypothetical protein
MLDVVLAVAIALATVVDVVRRPRQSARIRDGWVHEKFSGTRDEFVKQTRPTYMYSTWIGLVGGVLLLVGEWLSRPVTKHVSRCPRLSLTRMLVPRPAAVQDLPHAYGICWPTWIPFRHTADGRE